MARRTERAAAIPAADFLTDPEAARLLNVGLTKLAELEKTAADFPTPVRFGERAKRHVRTELLTWALGRRGRINGGA